MPKSLLPRGRNFLVTVNNPELSAEELQQLLDRNNVKYVFQRERGENGTEHYQLFVHCDQARTCNYVRSFLPTAHVEIARNAAAARAYCSKTDTRVEGPWSNFGEEEESKKNKVSMQNVMQDYQQGAPLAQLAQQYCQLFARNHTNILRTLDLAFHSTERNEKTEVYWIYGPTGVGKSRHAKQLAEEKSVYWKNCTEWWDHYTQQDVVIIDDYNGEWPINFLLQLFDRYPLYIQAKGSTKTFNSKKIILTSNYSPEHYYGGHAEQYRALLRRIEHIVEMK